MGKALPFAGCRIEPGHATGIGRHPQLVVAILRQVQDEIIRQAVFATAIATVELETVAIETVQAFLRADPDKAAAIPQHRVDAGLRQTCLGAVAIQRQFRLGGGAGR